ncbi:YdcH family protein [Defluviicoccus vanus]|uniref:YdcH family protein n=1 Tax=Defluviicoccus vanus TaxID=111831 RepID=A0A7H1N0T7_9PROT|nr:YdcH family protein [Defluviicoccus vanus]QNT69323.1 YdcH family protein [Defluviicoccus vanus]
MSLQERIDALKAKHHALERAIEEENNRPHPDDIEIVRLKKQKLQIKDEIAVLAARLALQPWLKRVRGLLRRRFLAKQGIGAPTAANVVTCAVGAPSRSLMHALSRRNRLLFLSAGLRLKRESRCR